MPARPNGVTRSRRPARGLENEVFLNLLRTADALLRDVEQILKAVELSQTQYNVLRILRGAGRQGLACQEIGERMLTRDPDITRLLDRLEARALVSRARGRADRRVVETRDRKSTRLNSSHLVISYAVFCLKKKKKNRRHNILDTSNTH